MSSRHHEQVTHASGVDDETEDNDPLQSSPRASEAAAVDESESSDDEDDALADADNAVRRGARTSVAGWRMSQAAPSERRGDDSVDVVSQGWWWWW